MKCEYVSELGTLRISCKNTRLEFQNWVQTPRGIEPETAGAHLLLILVVTAAYIIIPWQAASILKAHKKWWWKLGVQKVGTVRKNRRPCHKIGVIKQDKTSRLNNRSGHQQVKRHMCHQLYSTCYYFSLFSWWLFVYGFYRSKAPWKTTIWGICFIFFKPPKQAKLRLVTSIKQE